MPAPSDWAPSLDDITTEGKPVAVLPKSIIITGQPGAGKTTLAATAFGDLGPHLRGETREKAVLRGAVWLLSDEQGLVSLTVRGIRPEFVIDVRELLDKTDGHFGNALRHVHAYLEMCHRAGAHTVVVDTVSSLGGYLESWYVHGQGCPEAKSGADNKFKGWLLVGDKYFELYQTISALKYRAIWLAHPKSNKLEDDIDTVAKDRKATMKDKAKAEAKAVIAGTPGDNYIVPAISGQAFARILKGQCCISGWLRAEFDARGKRTTTWMPFGGDGAQGKNRYENILDRGEPADLYMMDRKIEAACE